MTTKAPGQTVGNAAKIAAELTGLALQHNTDPASIVPLFSQALDLVIAEIDSRIDHGPAQPAPTAGFNAEQSIQSNFPGTTIVPPPSAAPAAPNPGATVIQLPVPGPAAIPGAATPAATQGPDPLAVEAWTQFFNDIAAGAYAQNWEDLRPVKASGKMKANGPDFKHKSWKRPGDQYTVSVWIDGKGNPDWVKPKLAEIGVA